MYNVQRLETFGKLGDLTGNVIREQLNKGIVERVSGPTVGKEFHIPNKAVVGESAKSKKNAYSV